MLNTTSEYMEQGRRLAEARRLFLDHVLAQGLGTTAEHRKAATLFYQFIHNALQMEPPTTHELVRIYERFGESDRRTELAGLFDIRELSMLVRKSDEMVEFAISRKKLNPGMTLEELRVLLAGH
ncbi:hypothetical protein BVER_02690 [Candidatus Burkholderia verschuerenii]|uniref:Uncharacterized protein n=1 Tax=Candidatus Burkholderia verschuerenii TaxID=242163 RepID=A0A0L0M2P4_9BURK|nr:hypothetical protein [Candidatus Burkholderia verschuerenii]KND56932.1 hypothetical protein BVER_02690 [Candidatus Burkholderia verschuerenii]